MSDTTKEYLNILKEKYNKTSITRLELAKELGISESTIDIRIRKGTGIPRYKRSSKSPKATYIFPIVEVAKFLSEDLIVVA